jgi:hypothetical protein
LFSFSKKTILRSLKTQTYHEVSEFCCICYKKQNLKKEINATLEGAKNWNAAVKLLLEAAHENTKTR